MFDDGTLSKARELEPLWTVDRMWGPLKEPCEMAWDAAAATPESLRVAGSPALAST
jgi:hypothetical protein